jgi:hypothetical protein
MKQIESKRQALLTRQGYPKSGLQEMELELRQTIEDLQQQITNLEQEKNGQEESLEETSFEDKEKEDKEITMSQSQTSSQVEVSTEDSYPTLPDNILIQIELEPIYNAFTLEKGYEGSVPAGRIFVLSYDHDTYDQEGLPEVYLAGEVVSKNRLRGDVQCQVAELAEFPGKVSFRVIQSLTAISQTDDDVASLDASFYVRLRDPLLLLRRAGGNWMTERGRATFNEEVREVIRERLGQILTSRIQLWSEDEHQLYEKIFSSLDDGLRRIGLCVDTSNANAPETSIIAVRRYPANLYEIALQFAKAERTIRYMIEVGEHDKLVEQTGFSENDLRDLVVIEAETGVGLLLQLRGASPEMKEKVADWLETQGVKIAAAFVRDLYAEENAQQAIKLSEQVLLAAIRNPMLTMGEWLQRGSDIPQAPLFQRLQSRVERASAST